MASDQMCYVPELNFQCQNPRQDAHYHSLITPPVSGRRASNCKRLNFQNQMDMLPIIPSPGIEQITIEAQYPQTFKQTSTSVFEMTNDDCERQRKTFANQS